MYKNIISLIIIITITLGQHVRCQAEIGVDLPVTSETFVAEKEQSCQVQDSDQSQKKYAIKEISEKAVFEHKIRLANLIQRSQAFSVAIKLGLIPVAAAVIYYSFYYKPETVISSEYKEVLSKQELLNKKLVEDISALKAKINAKVDSTTTEIIYNGFKSFFGWTAVSMVGSNILSYALQPLQVEGTMSWFIRKQTKLNDIITQLKEHAETIDKWVDFPAYKIEQSKKVLINLIRELIENVEALIAFMEYELENQIGNEIGHDFLSMPFYVKQITNDFSRVLQGALVQHDAILKDTKAIDNNKQTLLGLTTTFVKDLERCWRRFEMMGK